MGMFYGKMLSAVGSVIEVALYLFVLWVYVFSVLRYLGFENC